MRRDRDLSGLAGPPPASPVPRLSDGPLRFPTPVLPSTVAAVLRYLPLINGLAPCSVSAAGSFRLVAASVLLRQTGTERSSALRNVAFRRHQSRRGGRRADTTRLHVLYVLYMQRVSELPAAPQRWVVQFHVSHLQRWSLVRPVTRSVNCDSRANRDYYQPLRQGWNVPDRELELHAFTTSLGVCRIHPLTPRLFLQARLRWQEGELDCEQNFAGSNPCVGSLVRFPAEGRISSAPFGICAPDAKAQSPRLLTHPRDPPNHHHKSTDRTAKRGG
ncbi:hypothetical protein AAFF_G00113770 [Aldrovandia affinis]|uniref:Uncharacterized protein n=1 Tax=Aldrovandia affinis TaxID=143900 RepID=A0AAD7WAU8_9TELE|nr:hypothetical protein AAFF_G00113770 [Aldrovandia affinis]